MRMFPLLFGLAVINMLTARGDASGEASFFPRPYPTGKDIVVMDMTQAGQDEKLTATTLQGLVNRQQEAKLYLLPAAWDSFWLHYLEEQGFIRSHAKISLEEALARHSPTIETLVLYDPALPAGINIATMMAAEQNGIVVSPENLYEHVLPEAKRIDLRKRWENNAEAYRWALENLLPVLNPSLLACYHPTACNHHIRDYLVQHKVFHFWASSESLDARSPTNAREERKVAEEILAATPPNIPVLGFWFSGADPGLDEYAGVGLAGEYGKITVVCDWATNLSLLGGIAVDLQKTVDRFHERAVVTPPVLDPAKVYLCMDIVESGDAPSYVQSRMHTVWQDAKRGSLPINWSLGPAIFDLAPPLAHYYYAEASPVDYLYLSISGAGYCHPYRALFSKTADPEQAWNRYLDLTRQYQTRMRCETLGLYTDAWKTFDRSVQDAVTKRFTAGLPGIKALILGMGRDDGIMPDAANYYLDKNDATLISHIMTRWPTDYATNTREENIAWLVGDIRSHTPESRPGFLHVMALSWAFGPAELERVLEQLGDEYVPLTAPQFTALYRSVVRP